MLPSCHLCMCFLGIGSLDFSEFQHGARNPYGVLHDTVRFFEKETFFAPKMGEMNNNLSKTWGFLNLKKNLVINSH